MNIIATALIASLAVSCAGVQTAPRRLTKWRYSGFVESGRDLCWHDSQGPAPAEIATEIQRRLLIEFQQCGALAPLGWSKVTDTDMVSVIVDNNVRLPQGGVPRYIRAANTEEARRLTRIWFDFDVVGMAKKGEKRVYFVDVLVGPKGKSDSMSLCFEENDSGFTVIPIANVVRRTKPCRLEDAERFPVDIPPPPGMCSGSLPECAGKKDPVPASSR